MIVIYFVMGYAGVIAHLLIKIGMSNKRTDTTVTIPKIILAYWKKDWWLILSSFLAVTVGIFIVSDPEYAGLPFIPESIAEKVDFRTRAGIFLVGFFVDSILMLLSKAENSLKQKE